MNGTVYILKISEYSEGKNMLLTLKKILNPLNNSFEEFCIYSRVYWLIMEINKQYKY
jgi:hypothetical protein